MVTAALKIIRVLPDSPVVIVISKCCVSLCEPERHFRTVYTQPNVLRFCGFHHLIIAANLHSGMPK